MGHDNSKKVIFRRHRTIPKIFSKSVSHFKYTIPVLSVIAILTLSIFVIGSSGYSNGQAATLVLGQSGFLTGTINNGGLSANSLSIPAATAFDGFGNLWVADAFNNRVLRFDTPITPGEGASIVLGQTSFISNSNNAGGLSASSLSLPSGVAIDPSNNIWVSDNVNSRILMFPAGVSTGGSATVVLGQPNFSSNTPNNGGTPAGPGTLSQPGGLAFDGSGNLWAVDYRNNRVLKYTAPISSGQLASEVIGQPDFISRDIAAPAPDSLNQPYSLTFNSGSLWVSDSWNNRILKFENPTTGSPATLVIGQSGFTTNNYGDSANELNHPYGLAFDSSGNLWASDADNSRVLRYDAPLSSGIGASIVLGHSSFDSSAANDGGLSSQSLNLPAGIALDSSGILWVVDSQNSRILAYGSDSTPPVITPVPVGTVGLPDWYTSDVSLTWTVTDPESNILSSIGCTNTNIVADQFETTYNCEATSAGGTKSNSISIKRDATMPTITASRTPDPNGNGWNNFDVVASYTASDGLSGLASGSAATGSFTFNAEGADQTHTFIVSDKAGNSASATISDVNIDKAVPTITVPSDITEYTTSISGKSVSFTATFADLGSAPSGLDGSGICNPPSPSNFATGIVTPVLCSATDKAGNLGTNSFSVTVIGFFINAVTDTKWGFPTTISGYTLGPINPADYSALVNAGDGNQYSASLSTISGSSPPKSTFSTTNTYSHGGTFTITEMLVKAANPSSELATQTSSTLALPHDTEFSSKKQRDAVLEGTNWIGWFQLRDKDFNQGVSGKQLVVTTSSISNAPAMVTTGSGARITAPSSIGIIQCNTPDPCYPDESQGSENNIRNDANINVELQLPLNSKLSLADIGAKIKQVNFCMTGNPNLSTVNLLFRDKLNAAPAVSQSFLLQSGAANCFGYQGGTSFPNGIGEVEVSSFTGGGSLAVAQIVASSDGFPPTKLDEDFQGLIGASSIGSDATLAGGDAYVSAVVPQFESIASHKQFTTAVNFNGDLDYVAASGSQTIKVKDTDNQAQAGVASGLISPASDTGLSSTFAFLGCNADPVNVHGDRDVDGICNDWEDQYFIPTSAGNFYICPGVTASSVDKNPCNLSKYHKNVLVELDCYTGRCPDDYDVNLVNAWKTAFANLNVENPDKTIGIRLTVQQDDRLTKAGGFTSARIATWIDAGSDTSNFNDYDHIFQIRGGTSAERTVATVSVNPLLKEGKYQVYHYGLVVPTIGTTSSSTIDCTGPTAFGVSETPDTTATGNQFAIALGCSTDGAADPNFSGAKLGNKWQLTGIFYHEMGHQLGLYHHGTVKAQNLWQPPVTANDPLTKTPLPITTGSLNVVAQSATLISPPSVTVAKVTGTSVSFAGPTLTTTGAWAGSVQTQTTLTISATGQTVTASPATVPASGTGAVGAGLSVNKPVCKIASGKGTTSQVLSCTWPVSSVAAVSSAANIGTWTVPLTLTGGSTVSGVSSPATATLVDKYSVSFTGPQIPTTGKWEGYLQMTGRLTLSAVTTVTQGTTTPTSTAVGSSLSVDKPLCTITSGGGSTSQTLSCYWMVKTASSAPSGTNTLGTWTIPLNLAGSATLSAATPTASPTVNVPSIIYTTNCDPNYPSVVSYSFQEPKLVDAASYYTGIPPVYNTAYAPIDWNKIYTHPYTGSSYATLNNKYLGEPAGILDTYYAAPTTAQKTVFGHSNAAGTGRVADTQFMYLSGASPVWMDFNGDTSSAPSAEDINNLGIDGCGSSSTDFFEPGVLADTKHLNLIMGSAGGTIESFSSHADESTLVQGQTYVQANLNSGFMQPINTNGHLSKFNLGSTIPAKFILLKLSNPADPTSPLVIDPSRTDLWFKAVFLSPDTSCDLTAGCDAEVGTIATPSTGVYFSWDGNQYNFNWKTNKSMQAGLYRIFALQGSESIISTEIVLK